MFRLWKNKILWALIISLITSVGIYPLISGNFLDSWNSKAVTYLYREEKIDPKVVIIAIDEKSLNDKTGLGRWPWRRNIHADLIKVLAEQGAKVIAFDVVFTEKSNGIYDQEQMSEVMEGLSKEENNENYFKKITNEYFNTSFFTNQNHPDDQKLIDTVNQYDNIILAATGTYDGQNKNFLPAKSIISLKNNNEWGVVKIMEEEGKNDEQKYISKIPFNFFNPITKTTFETLPVKAVKKYLGIKTGKIANGNYYLGDKIKIPLEDYDQMNINFRTKSYSFPYISYVDALNGKFIDTDRADPRNDQQKIDLKDKIVIIGGTASRVFHDELLTPISRISAKSLMPGVEIQANAIQTILDQKFLLEQKNKSQLIIIFILALLCVLAVNYLPALFSGILIIAIFIGYYFLALFAFDRGTIINMVNPYIALLFTYILSLIYKYFAETKDKKEIKVAFSRYVNEEIVNEISKHPDQLSLGGEKRIMTVFFSDIAGFTSVSEKMEPYKLVAFLNDYLDAMSKVILKNHGTIDKYEGDAIMAFWGAPLVNPNHAYYACLTALECRQVIRELHQKWQARNLPLIDFRVGLNTGEMIVGNMGSEKHFGYTIIGDAVNLGSRLEGANKEFGTKIMVSDSTYSLVKDQFTFRKLGQIKVKGKEQEVLVYELLGGPNCLNYAQKEFVDSFHQALEAYEKKDYPSAKELFLKAQKIIPEDKACQYYLEKIPGTTKV